MKVLNIGSMNLDYVYQVDHIVQPGETESAGSRSIFLGGKGMNQSVALARAGVEVYHGGMLGPDGQAFLDACGECGVNSDFIRTVSEPTGHTIIQIDHNAQNCILLYGGANQCLTEEYVDEVLGCFSPEDILLLQNEVNRLPYLIDQAYEKGMTIALNPSPFDDKLQSVDLSKVSIFLLNEVEGGQITGLTKPEEILTAMADRFPTARIVLTLGREGAIYACDGERHFQPAFPVQAVDTTAAGDTFTGYFLAGLTKGLSISETLLHATMASAIAVTRPGAVSSIPTWDEVLYALTKV